MTHPHSPFFHSSPQSIDQRKCWRKRRKAISLHGLNYKPGKEAPTNCQFLKVGWGWMREAHVQALPTSSLDVTLPTVPFPGIIDTPANIKTHPHSASYPISFSFLSICLCKDFTASLSDLNKRETMKANSNLNPGYAAELANIPSQLLQILPVSCWEPFTSYLSLGMNG